MIRYESNNCKNKYAITNLINKNTCKYLHTISSHIIPQLGQLLEIAISNPVFSQTIIHVSTLCIYIWNFLHSSHPRSHLFCIDVYRRKNVVVAFKAMEYVCSLRYLITMPLFVFQYLNRQKQYPRDVSPRLIALYTPLCHLIHTAVSKRLLLVPLKVILSYLHNWHIPYQSLPYVTLYLLDSLYFNEGSILKVLHD